MSPEHLACVTCCSKCFLCVLSIILWATYYYHTHLIDKQFKAKICTSVTTNPGILWHLWVRVGRIRHFSPLVTGSFADLDSIKLNIVLGIDLFFSQLRTLSLLCFVVLGLELCRQQFCFASFSCETLQEQRQEQCLLVEAAESSLQFLQCL